MILVIGSVVAAPGKVDEALALSRTHVERSRREPGCVSHAVHRDTENLQRLVFVERWSDREALQAHFRVPASRSFVQSLTALVAESPAMEIYDAEPIRI